MFGLKVIAVFAALVAATVTYFATGSLLGAVAVGAVCTGITPLTR